MKLRLYRKISDYIAETWPGCHRDCDRRRISNFSFTGYERSVETWKAIASVAQPHGFALSSSLIHTLLSEREKNGDVE